MPLRYKHGISYYTFPVFDDFHLVHGLFMRMGGISLHPWHSLNMATSVGDTRETIIENRKRITECLALGQDSIFDVWQVHGKKVICSEHPRQLDQEHQKADAIITDKENVTLMMLFADCVPILIFDPQKRVAAIAHAGWKGTVNNVIEKTIDTMVNQFVCTPNDLIACIGPSICADHYEVGKEVEQEVNLSFEQSQRVLRKNNGKTHFNLQMANQINLEKCGVRKIYQSGICTACNTNDWFSHRGENGRTGRYAAVMTVLQN